MKSGVFMQVDKLASVMKSISVLASYKVLAGIPEAKAPRKNAVATGEMNNAAIGYIQERGSPLANIPARPFLATGISDAKPDITRYFKQAAEAGLAGDSARVVRALSAAGQSAASAAQMRIKQGIPPALKPKTIAARQRRSAGSKYRRKENRQSGAIPLYDTGELLRSITFVVKKS